MAIRNSYQQHINPVNPKRFDKDLLCLNENAGIVFFDKRDRCFDAAKKLRFKCLCT